MSNITPIGVDRNLVVARMRPENYKDWLKFQGYSKEEFVNAFGKEALKSIKLFYKNTDVSEIKNLGGYL